MVKEIGRYAPNEELGFYLSYFWGYVIMAGLFGNYIGYLIFYNGFIKGFFLIMGSLSIFAACYFMMLKSDINDSNIKESIPLVRRQNSFVEETYSETFYKFIGILFSKRMGQFWPMFMWTGISLSFSTGLLSPIIMRIIPKMSESDEYSYSMLITFCLAFG